MTVKLHRCSTMWLKIGAHPCWRVQRELNEAGVDYEVVKGPVGRGKRAELEQLSGQRQYPVIEFEDGTIYREQSKGMAARIKSGRLMEVRGAGSTAGSHSRPESAEGHQPAEQR